MPAGTGKTVLREAFAQSSHRQVTPHISRTLHTYSSILRILCQSLAIEYQGGDLKCEKQVIEQAHQLHRNGKAIALTIDEAHLLAPQHLRKLRLLLEESPGNYAIVLFAQSELLARLALYVNEDLRSRITYSTILNKLTGEDIESFLLREFERVGLAHSRMEPAALDLIATSKRWHPPIRREPDHSQPGPGRTHTKYHRSDQARQHCTDATTLA